MNGVSFVGAFLKGHCENCNRTIETHLRDRGSHHCFACLVEQVSSSGTALPTFKIKEKPVHAPCAVCGADTPGPRLHASNWGYLCQECSGLCETQTGFRTDNLSILAQREWLIRSMKKVLGPFTTDEVNQMLHENRVVALDEVAAPLGRWQLIRDNDTFRFVLNEIRNRRAHDTDATREQTGSGTDAITESLTNPFGNAERLMAKAQESAGQDEQESEREVSALEGEPESIGRSRDLVKTYAYEKDKSKRSPRTHAVNPVYLWVVAVVCVLSLTIVVARQSKLGISAGGSGGSGAFQDVMARGLKAERIGQYRKALDLFMEAQNLKPRDPEMLLHLAPLTLVYDRQFLQAQRMFKQILDTEQGVNYQKAAHMGLGLVALENHEYEEAAENFIAANKLDPSLYQAAGNLGIVQYFQGRLSEAEVLLLKSTEKVPEGAFSIALADVDIALSDERGEKSKLSSIHEMLTSMTALTADYLQEALVTDAKVSVMLGKKSEAKARIEAFLDTDPEQTDLHLRDWMVYRGRVSWDLLLESYRRVASSLERSPRLTAGLGLTMYKSHEKIDGAQTIEQALAQNGNDPMIQALAGWVQLKLGKREQGAANIHDAVKTQHNYKMPYILAARLCEEDKDFECAKKHWESVLRIQGNSVQGLTGLARYYFETKNKEQASIYVKQALASDPTYIPAVALLQEIQPPSGEGTP